MTGLINRVAFETVPPGALPPIADITPLFEISERPVIFNVTSKWAPIAKRIGEIRQAALAFGSGASFDDPGTPLAKCAKKQEVVGKAADTWYFH
jgi:hypothetical protein